jgi:hypothetical protein
LKLNKKKKKSLKKKKKKMDRERSLSVVFDHLLRGRPILERFYGTNGTAPSPLLSLPLIGKIWCVPMKSGTTLEYIKTNILPQAYFAKGVCVAVGDWVVKDGLLLAAGPITGYYFTERMVTNYMYGKHFAL